MRLRSRCAGCLVAVVVSLLVFGCLTAGPEQTFNNFPELTEPAADMDVIRIGLLLPASGSWTPGRTILGAASLAVERINSDASLLGDKKVEFVWRDSGVCARTLKHASMQACT